MTYEDQLGSIVSRLKAMQDKQTHLETDLESLLGDVETHRQQLAMTREAISRIEADIITFRAQTARPE